jgi:hypothetical protein
MTSAAPTTANGRSNNWCYNRQHRTDFCAEPRFLSFIDRPILIDTVRGILDPGAHVTGGSLMQIHYGSALVERQYPAMRWESLWSPEVIAQATPEQKKLLGAR